MKLKLAITGLQIQHNDSDVVAGVIIDTALGLQGSHCGPGPFEGRFSP